jgi:hypothetical protein
MANLSISAKHPVRAAVSEVADYHECLADAVHAVREALAAHNLRMDDPVFEGCTGWTTCIIRPDPDHLFVCGCCEDKLDRAEFDNVVAFSYYQTRIGRWEVIKYIS